MSCHSHAVPIIFVMQSFRIHLTAIAIVCFFQVSLAQKHDYIWEFGYNYNPTTPQAEAYDLNFDTFPPRVQSAERNIFMINGYSNICDSAGNKLFLSNNCRIVNLNGTNILQGDSMVTDFELDYCNLYGWHPYEFYSCFLPIPGYSDRFYYFDKSTFKSNGGPLVIYTNEFQYSVVDVTDSGIDGAVILKNKVIINNEIGYGQISSVKHGNGQDWWLPVPARFGNKIYMVYAGKDTVYMHHAHSLGPTWGEIDGFQASFSLDGTKYVRYNPNYGLYLYDFDRCDGTLSNLQYFNPHDTILPSFGGCAVSPNNRWMYLADFDYLYQFDLKAPDILASKQVIAVWDGVSNNLPTKFSYIIYGPDHRLYVFPPTTTKNLHVINRPDLPQTGCDFQQRAIEFPYPYQNYPVFPNFRLGPLDGSPCDTLGINNHPLADFRPDPTDTNALAVRFWDVSSYEPAQWVWDFGDGSPVRQDTSPVHTFPASGFYTVCLTVANQYSGSSKCKVVEVKTVGYGSEPSGQGGGLVLYPNPSTGLVSVSGLDVQGCLAEITDLSGRAVAAVRFNNGNFDLSGLPSGLYFLRVSRPRVGILGIGKIIINK